MYLLRRQYHSALFRVRPVASLYQKTYKVIREWILTGSLASGERLIEQRLSERLEVSRTPIREALRQLQRENLVQTDQSGSLRVTVVSIADAIQLYDCRLGLEQVAAIGACENATLHQLEELKQSLVQARLSSSSISLFEGSQEPQIDQVDELDNRLGVDQNFHYLLAESSGNPWLLNLLEQVFSQMALLRLATTYRNPDVLEIWTEHERIIEALDQRDSAAAAAAVRSHLVASKIRVIQELQALQDNNLVAKNLTFPLT